MTVLVSGTRVDQARRILTQIFTEAGLEDCAQEARILVGHATGLTHADMVMAAQDPLPNDTLNALEIHANDRLAGRPLSDILGYRDFWKDRFFITQDVLTPRPETEGIIEAALGLFSTDQALSIVDLGTGSGAIILSLLGEFPNAAGLGIDISEAALSVAKRNSDALDVECTFALSNWLEAVDACFDLIVSNPPYITHAQMDTLDIEVSEFDPDLALRGGDDGLDPYRAILSKFSPAGPLTQNGAVIFEVGRGQAADVAQMMTARGLTPTLHKDLSGIERIVIGQYAEKDIGEYKEETA